jgi:peptidyl-prolyl cis-trans isomerase C
MSESRVLAVVQGKEITEETVLKFLNDLGPQMAMQFQSPEGMKRVVDELVNQEIIYLDAKEKEMEKEEEYLKELDRLKEGLMKQYAVNKLLKDIRVTEDEVEKYYNDNKDRFKKPESIVASHILVEDEEKANNIVKEINGGLSFEDAALKYSTCPSKDQGGNLGEFTRGQMVPEFDQAAFDMEVGPISEPVKTNFGYHIIKVAAKNESSLNSFEEVKDQLTQQLLGIKQQEFYLTKTDELKQKYDVVVNM